MATRNSTPSFPKNQSIQPQRIGLHEVIRNRFTGRSYLVAAAPLALPAPIAAEQPAPTVRPATTAPQHSIYTALDRAHALMCEQAGVDDPREAHRILLTKFIATHPPTILLGAGR